MAIDLPVERFHKIAQFSKCVDRYASSSIVERYHKGAFARAHYVGRSNNSNFKNMCLEYGCSAGQATTLISIDTTGTLRNMGFMSEKHLTLIFENRILYYEVVHHRTGPKTSIELKLTREIEIQSRVESSVVGILILEPAFSNRYLAYPCQDGKTICVWEDLKLTELSNSFKNGSCSAFEIHICGEYLFSRAVEIKHNERFVHQICSI